MGKDNQYFGFSQKKNGICCFTEQNADFTLGQRRGKLIEAYLTNLYQQERAVRPYVILDDNDMVLIIMNSITWSQSRMQ
ncbi:MAG: hypothetical protein IKM98_13575 [Bacteroidales bacterium]|nr:hypothetical protein [Bacteroidales bacterium]